ncbi:hypothetical protein K1T71_004174 [Dendrolimus kikuchii]|uniref:Uncharacterized protein n=1 Tax=Dendrolimus kikuchii TaxID=765133 RepID=A0ACC1DAB2_9NEOP|nr:hypothetical protein K1T71_004174 [Dendrolimus kikuchii]
MLIVQGLIIIIGVSFANARLGVIPQLGGPPGVQLESYGYYPDNNANNQYRPEECPKVKCPHGYNIQYTTTSVSSYSLYSSALPPPRPRVSYQRYYSGGYSKRGRGGFSKGGYTKSGRPGSSKGGYYPYNPPPQDQGFTLDKPSLNNSSVNNIKQECRQFKCIPQLPPFQPGFMPGPVLCPIVSCPRGYTLKLEKAPTAINQCPQYECVPPPERHVYCNITGSIINTFDGTQYNYDICFHLLVREYRFDSWVVVLRKSSYNFKNELLIYQDDKRIIVKSNMMIEYDSYEYTVEQMSRICFQMNNFDINRVGNVIAIRSRKYEFTVLYTSYGDVKIGVLKTHLSIVDGMCGVYDGSPSNDRSLPDGRLANSIEEFGQMWAKPGLPKNACEVNIIPPVEEEKCSKMCDVITKEPFSQCGTVLNLDKWRHICMEKVCECAESKNNAKKMTNEQCRCQLLESLVAECLAADKNIDIAAWRMLMGCQADCPAPLVHYDCYRRSCEPTCSSVGALTSCPLVDGQCFPGCYCPEGKLRKGDKCVVPADCLDCTCTGVGTPAKYITFEGNELPFLANCTYLASRDRKNTNQYKYEVYATNGPCEDSGVVCTKAVHLIYEKHVLHITKDPNTKKLITTIGDTVTYKYPSKTAWATISVINGQDITVVLPDIHVELTVFQNKMEFHVNVPSFLYGNQTEGLCGVCAGHQDVLITRNGTITDDIDEYGESWKASTEALTILNLETEQCEQLPPPKKCVTPLPDVNPCNNLYDADRFGACFALVDPEPYVVSCDADLCLNATDSCVAMARYAAACRAQGICLNDWRIDLCPYPCEEPFVYRAYVDCERTCDNYDELEKYPQMCTNKPVEGCFCPEGKVRVNNTCIEPNKCFPCDAKNEHYAGDEWQEDACTTCKCQKMDGKNGVYITASCLTENCPMMICSELEDLIAKPLVPGRCCQELSCVPKPVKNCTEPKMMECGFGQVLKQKTTPNGCKEFACECKPASECPSLSEQEDGKILEPGMVKLVDDSGCCPRLQFLCKVETCPQAPECPKFYTLKTEKVTEKCCPVHKCEPPKDKCIASLEWKASAKGGEKARNKPETLLKDLDAVWADGPCRICRCESSPLGPVASCTATECPSIVSTDQFVVEPLWLPFQCCPVAVQVACRDGNNIYKVGKNWTSTDNVCEKYRCEEVREGKLERVKTVEHCEEKCIPGWQYFPAEKGSGQCCGKCVQVACLVNGQEKSVGAKWQSEDFCTNYTCADINGTLQVRSSIETCPEIPESVRKQFVVKEVPVKGQCCPKIRTLACIYNKIIYLVGETWSTLDPCKKITCTRNANGDLVQEETTKSCMKKCKLGWKYLEPSEDVCCGRCVQESCVIKDELKTPGTKWMSADNCTTFSCVKFGDQALVVSAMAKCPDLSECAPENIVNDTCCQICNITSDNLRNCVPTSIPSSQTVGMIRVRNAHHGLCVNQKPVKGFKECRGTCDSGALFNNATGSYDSNCECCQVTEYSPLTVEVNCMDGTVQKHRVNTPLTCACRKCGISAAPPCPFKHGCIGTKTPQWPTYDRKSNPISLFTKDLEGTQKIKTVN